MARLSAIYGVVLRDLGRMHEACTIYEDSLPIVLDYGVRTSAANINNNLGLLYINLGEYAKARPHLENAVAIGQELGDDYNARDSLGELELTEGNLEAAQMHFYYVLNGIFQTGDIVLTVFMINQFARLCAKQGNFERSAELVGFASSHPAADSELKGHAEELLESLNEEFGEDILEAFLQRGQAYELEVLVSEILDEFAPQP